MKGPQVTGGDQLTSIFGYWPSFHDAEVISMTLDRGGKDEFNPKLTAKVHVFEISDEISPKGFYITKKHSVVTFEFRRIVDFSLSGFNQQNSLFGLSIVDISDHQLERVKFEVGFDSSNGAKCEFKCEVIEILSIEKGMPKDSIYNKD